ncbi:MAG: hypothetical protein LQ351_006431 [Letrouitia transgressa]|nr:MAG: hypothetical protein LQ351_006431 [Letrouitia transgressa]
MQTSFYSNTSRPSIPLSRSISQPDHSDYHPRAPELTLSFPLENSKPAPQEPALAQDLTIESTKAQWLEALAHFNAIRLQSSLSIFKRLVRSLIFSILPDIIRTNIKKILSKLWTNIALIHGFLGSYRLSAEAFEEAAYYCKDNALAWYGLGIARFLLRKFDKAIQAWDRCIARFSPLDEDGKATQDTEISRAQVFGGSQNIYSRDNTPNDEIVYKVYCPAKRCTEIEALSDAKSKPHCHGRLNYTALGDVQMVQGLEDGAWHLEKIRVEWNVRVAIIEQNWDDKGAPRPGNGTWGLNGICAGVIFGPVPELDAASNTYAKKVAPLTKKGGSKSIWLGHRRNKSKEEESLKNDKSGKAGSLVRQKWSTLQQKMLKRRSANITEQHEETARPPNFSPQSSEKRTNEPWSIPSPSPPPPIAPPPSPQTPLLAEKPTSLQQRPSDPFQNDLSLDINDLIQCQARLPSVSLPFPRPTTAEGTELQPIYESEPSCHSNIIDDVKFSRNGFPRRTSSLSHSLRLKRHRNASLSSFHSQDTHTESENLHHHLQSLNEEEQVAEPSRSQASVSHGESSRNGEPDIYLPNLFNDLLAPSPPLYPPHPPRFRSRPRPRLSPLSYHAMTSTATTFLSNRINSEQQDQPIFGEHSGYLTDEVSTLGSTQHGRFFASLSSFNSRRPSDVSPYEPSSLENSTVINLADETETMSSAWKPHRGHKRNDTSLTLRPSDPAARLGNDSEPQTGTVTTDDSFAERYDDITTTPATDFAIPRIPHFQFPPAEVESRPSTREGDHSSSTASDGEGVSPKSHQLPRSFRKQHRQSALNPARERRMSVSPLRINVSASSRLKDQDEGSEQPIPSSDTLPSSLLNAHVIPMSMEDWWELDSGVYVPGNSEEGSHVDDVSLYHNESSYRWIAGTGGEYLQLPRSDTVGCAEDDEGEDWRQWRYNDEDEFMKPSEWVWEEAYEQWMAAGQSSVLASSALLGSRVLREESPDMGGGEYNDPALGDGGVLLPRTFEGFAST